MEGRIPKQQSAFSPPPCNLPPSCSSPRHPRSIGALGPALGRDRAPNQNMLHKQPEHWGGCGSQHPPAHQTAVYPLKTPRLSLKTKRAAPGRRQARSPSTGATEFLGFSRAGRSSAQGSLLFRIHPGAGAQLRLHPSTAAQRAPSSSSRLPTAPLQASKHLASVGTNPSPRAGGTGAIPRAAACARTLRMGTKYTRGASAALRCIAVLVTTDPGRLESTSAK